MKEELLNNLYNAYDFLYVDEEYRELIGKFESDTESCKNKYLRTKNTKVTVFPIYLAALYASVILLILGGLLGSQLESPILIGIVVCVAGLILILAHKIAKQRKKAPEKEAMDFWNNIGSPTCIENESKITKIKEELESFRIKNENVLYFLPEDYQDDIEAVGYMIHVIKNGLADSLKEALQLYTEQKHRWEVEAAMHGIAKTMELHNREMEAYMSEISEQQRIANSKLADIEMLTFLDYINK